MPAVTQRIFVSYNKADRQWAEWIAWQLEEAGYETTIQAWDFAPGGNFVLEMQKAAASADRTIAVLSPDYLASAFTQPEWAAAFARDPKGEERRLVPVRVRECNLEGLLPQIIYIDFVGAGEEEARTKLIEGLAPGRKKPATPPAFPGGGSHSAAKEPPSFPGVSATTPARPRRQRPFDPDYLFFNVPLLSEHFLGRDKLVAEMVQRLTSSTGAAALSAKGQAGVGKTTLAVAIAHSPEIIEHFTDGVLWAGLGPKADVTSVLASWGDALGVDVSGIAETQQRAQAIRNRIGLRKLLLVSDDVWDGDTALLLKQCGGPNCVHLLTTRDDSIARSFAGSEGTQPIPELDEEPAFVLLGQLAPEACDADPRAARELTRAVGCLPLAVELVGAYLAVPERSLFPELSASTFAELADPMRRLLLAKQRLGSVDRREMTLEEVVKLSLEALPEASVDTFYRLGSFAPKPNHFDLTAAQTVSETSLQSVASLINHNLLQHLGGNMLALHKVVSDVARTQTPPDAIKRHKAHYLRIVREAGENWQLIEHDYGQIRWAFQATTGADEVTDFALTLFAYQFNRGLLQDAFAWTETGLSLANELGGDDTLPGLLSNMATVSMSLGRTPKALTFLEEALRLATVDGHIDLQITIINNIGNGYLHLERFSEALHQFKTALAMRREHENNASEARILNNIASAYEGLDENYLALTYHKSALRIRRKAGDRTGEATSLNNIGVVLKKLQRLGESLKHYQQALLLRRVVGDRSGEADTLGNMGKVYEELHHQTKAMEYFSQSLAIIQEVGDPIREAGARFNMALLLMAQKRWSEALPQMARVVEIESEYDAPRLAQDRALLNVIESQLQNPRKE